MDNGKELFPLVDEEGNIIGSITRQEAHSGTKQLHPVVHLHLFNSKGELYLQLRPSWKDVQPGHCYRGTYRLGRERGDGAAT